MASSSKESAEEAITEEEMAAATPSHDVLQPNSPQSRKTNACTPHMSCSLICSNVLIKSSSTVIELMSRKSKPVAKAADQSHEPKNRFVSGRDRDGLGAYTKDPASFPRSVVIYADGDWVVIYDNFPKATVHLLLLPRSPEINSKHPFDALADPDFLASAKAEASKWRGFVASELRRQFGSQSATESTRRAAMEEDPPPDAASLPPGRDWAQEVRSGIHAHPSMNHLHIHVISQDMHSQRMKHRKHYNSFKTPFFIDLDDFPIAVDDVRRHPGKEGYLQSDLKCWRCGKNFGNAFARLKEHLVEEFEEWKKQ